jgi:predicted O-methyltransferase YrrM
VPASWSQDRWTAVDRYLADRLLEPDAALDAALEASAAAGLPAHGVSPTQGRLLELHVRIQAGNAEYLGAALELSRPGTLIVADNVIRGGSVLDGDDANAVGVRRFFDLFAAEPRLRATAIQTVGEKGYDGFALAVVL